MPETITDIFFGGWRGVFNAAVIGGLAYLGFIALLHAFGKAMLMKASAASLVMTTALGSGLATIVLVEKISLIDGLASFTTIMALQTAFIGASAHSKGQLGGYPAVVIRLYISHVPHVMLAGVQGAVGGIIRIEMASGR
ncbi:hypothetical protein Q6D67_17795 [Haliea sp. E1-2-M8]|nr:hypothetical protein [Haliea sp. E1-2-M8]MDO8863556.1 hypothetical protein [Haliea sp. E1-2-M8]